MQNNSSAVSSQYSGELELPLVALLLVIVAPYEVMNLRQANSSF